MTNHIEESAKVVITEQSDAILPPPSWSASIDVTQHTVYQHFAKAGDLYPLETEVLGEVIRALLSRKEHVSNKDIILSLITRLEAISDFAQRETVRRALEIVVGITPDDV